MPTMPTLLGSQYRGSLPPNPGLRVGDAIASLHCIAGNDGYDTLYVRETDMSYARVYLLSILGAELRSRWLLISGGVVSRVRVLFERGM